MKLSNFGCKYLHTRWAARDFLHHFSYLTQFCSAHFFSLLLQRESDRVTRNVSASAVRQKSITVPSLPLWFLIISGKCISFIRPHCMCMYRTVRRLVARTEEHYFWQVGGKKCSLVLANQHSSRDWAFQVVLTIQGLLHATDGQGERGWAPLKPAGRQKSGHRRSCPSFCICTGEWHSPPSLVSSYYFFSHGWLINALCQMNSSCRKGCARPTSELPNDLGRSWVKSLLPVWRTAGSKRELKCPVLWRMPHRHQMRN